jgi:hypothetical protein
MIWIVVLRSDNDTAKGPKSNDAKARCACGKGGWESGSSMLIVETWIDAMGLHNWQ